MPLELREVTKDSEWNELIQCECESYEDPFNGIYILFRPDRGNSPKGREGFKGLRDRQLAWHKQDPTSKWFKVVDTDIGDKVVGGACWNIFTENPYPEVVEHPTVATWWPEGEGGIPPLILYIGPTADGIQGEAREFVNKLMDDWLCPRYHTMARPHIRTFSFPPQFCNPTN